MINPLSYEVEAQEKIGGGGAAAKPDADGGTACLSVHRADGGTARRGAAA
jgi:hypothetical protein